MRIMNIFNVMMVVIVLVIMVGVGLNVYNDYKNYNHGKCRYCDGQLLLIDYGSRRGRLYMCGRCQCSVWISWPVD